MGSRTFSPSTSWQAFSVPAGVTQISIDARGAGGQAASVPAGFTGAVGQGGAGARIVTTINVVPGETLSVAVGYAGASGGTSGPDWSGGNGGGPISNAKGGTGGGCTRVYSGGSGGVPVIIAAGGGGGGCPAYPGINQSGGTGGAGGTTSSSAIVAGAAGSGVGNAQGGGAGTASSVGGGGSTGGSNGGSIYAGVGGSTAGQFWGLGGGGGGGLYGGGGGGRDNGTGNAGGGGGGGSSYVLAGKVSGSIAHTRGYNSGNGVVYFTWTDPPVNTAPTIDNMSVTPSGTIDVDSVNVDARVRDIDSGDTAWAIFILDYWTGSEWAMENSADGNSSSTTSYFWSSAVFSNLVDGRTYRIRGYAYDGETVSSILTSAQFVVDLPDPIVYSKQQMLI